ncbi:hypothetical protein PAPHI01_0326 [Pancytospora philotis]|nr:hypothetical protein PAPHI01_0326 [Pancytospora philotis]
MRVFIFLLLTHSRPAESESGKKSDPWPEYKYFGASNIPVLTAIEAQMLDPLYRCCSKLISPEYPPELLDRRAYSLSPNDKARNIIFSVLKSLVFHQHAPAQSAMLGRLIGACGYAGHRLLLKLFSEEHVVSLKVPQHVAADQDWYQEYNALAAAHQDLLEGISSLLHDKMNDESKVPLKQYAERHEKVSSALDYLLLTLERNRVEPACMSSELSELADFWLDNYEYFKKQQPTIRCYFQTLLLLNFFPKNKQSSLAKHILISAADKSQPEYLDFFFAVKGSQAAKKIITRMLTRRELPRFDPHFTVYYFQKISKLGDLTDTGPLHDASIYFFRDALTFIQQDSIFKERRELFNLISSIFLCDVFKYLKGLPDDSPIKSSCTSHFMSLLDIETFFNIVWPIEGTELTEMMAFMILHLDMSGKEEYMRYTYLHHNTRSEQRKNIYTHINDILRSLGYEWNGKTMVAVKTQSAEEAYGKIQALCHMFGV